MNLKATVKFKGAELRVAEDDTLPEGVILLKFPKGSEQLDIRLINVGEPETGE